MAEFPYLNNNITSLLQDVQQFKSNLREFRIVTMNAYEKQIVTEITTLENRDAIERTTE